MSAVFWGATAALFLGLAVAAVIDQRTGRIPDLLNLALGGAGLIATTLLGRDLLAAALGAGVGYGALWAVNEAFLRARGYEGIGMGDAKLAAALGVWLGWAGLPFVVLIASASGLAGVGLARVLGRPLSAQSVIAFGPYLALGGAIVWLATALRPG